MPSDLDAKLEAAKASGGTPFFVSCTAGTTVLGSFDPIHDIADVCKKHGVWFHVDVSTGTAALTHNDLYPEIFSE